MLISFVLLFFSLFLGKVQGSCLHGALEWKANCYVFNSTASGYARAESACIRSGGHLASIHDGFTNDIIGQNAPDYFNSVLVTDFWIGVNDLVTPNVWAWTDGTPYGDYLDWGRGQPSNKTGFNCGVWMTADCFTAKPFVCAIPNQAPTSSLPSTTIEQSTRTTRLTTTTPSSGSCSTGWLYFNETNSCYLINMSLQSIFQQAEDYCKTFGAHLASIHSLNELAFLNAYVLRSCHAIWIGLHSVDEANTWQWTDGTTFDYIVWQYGQPPGTSSTAVCGILSDSSCSNNNATDGYFEAFDCNSNWGATVCKKSVM